MRLCRRVPVWLLVLCLLSAYLVYQILNPPVSTWTPGCSGPNDDYVRALAGRASADRYVILALVDAAFADMAVNLYESSLRPNNIANFLFVGAGRRACELVWNASLPCFYYTDVAGADTPSVYLSPDFIRKMNIRTDMILDALAAGFTVVHTDLDVVFFANPLPFLKTIMLEADMAALWDSIAFNAGFVVVRPTFYGRRVYETMRRVTTSSRRVDDQKAMNYVIRRMQRVYGSSGFRAKPLDRDRFVCGVDYFETPGRWYPTDSATATGHNTTSDGGAVQQLATDRETAPGVPTVVHNNWIVSREAKIYRFKEHLMWMYDKDSYYSSSSRRYVIYNNSVDPSWLTHSDDVDIDSVEDDDDVIAGRQLDSLAAALALGQLLDRVVILPRFHCRNVTKSGRGSGGRRQLGSVAHAADANWTSTTTTGSSATAVSAEPSTVPTDDVSGNVADGFFDCPLNSLLSITAFDSKFDGRYRENSFLRHPLVPSTVRQSVSRRYAVGLGTDVEAASPTDADDHRRLRKLVEVLRRDQSQVLLVDALDGRVLRTLIASFGPQLAGFNVTVHRAFKRSNYRQL